MLIQAPKKEKLKATEEAIATNKICGKEKLKLNKAMKEFKRKITPIETFDYSLDQNSSMKNDTNK